MKKILLTFLFALMNITSWAYDAEIDGFYYSFNNTNKTASVTYDTQYHNDYIDSIAIPSSVTYDGVKYSVTTIGSDAFNSCSGLTSIIIPESVTNIGDRAFLGCSSLVSIIIPNSVMSIGESAFWRCSGLTSITLPNSLTSIENGTFYDCSGLTSIIIPESVTRIGSDAFYGCSSLSSIIIPESVTSFGHFVFEHCSNLVSITLPKSMTSIYSLMFKGCSSLASINIPESVTSIDYEAFAGCSSLTSINIPNYVTRIGESAFQGCSRLQKLTIGSGVREIYDYAFAGDGHITEIHSLTIVPPTCKSTTFDQYVYVAADLYVPNARNAVERYKADEVWKNFEYIYGENTEEEKSELEKLQAAYEELQQEVEMLRNGDLNKDGSIDIEDVALLISLENYSSDKDALTTLTDGSSISVEEIAEKYGDVEYYSLDGKKVDEPAQSGIYIVKKDGKTKMIVVKK